VARRVHDAFVEAMVAETRKIKLGHGIEPGILYGPVLNEAVRGRVSRHLEDARAKGGRVVVGGAAPAGERFARGTFFEPTLVDGPTDDALVMTEETYGPLSGIRSFAEDDEAIRLANMLPYGLAAYVYSSDLERAWSFADKIEAGAVGINVNDTTELQAPFGGWKLSGFGSELGPEGLRNFLSTKHTRLRLRA
jgi:succinate-semialdehyde dehydrogenase/glutarate-semialdehyde dehydrogenase